MDLRVQRVHGLLAAVILLSVLGAGCSFFRAQTKANMAATCQRSCSAVPADTQGDCITRCQNQ